MPRCLQKASEADDFQPQAARAPPPAPVVSVLPRTKAKLEVPPKLVFSMLSNKELQAKLRAHKLPTDGRRHVSGPSKALLIELLDGMLISSVLHRLDVEALTWDGNCV